MLDIITNPIFVAVIIMTVLCMMKMNVFFSIIIAALVCGILGGATILETIQMFIGGLSSDSEGLVTRLLLGCVATCMVASGLGDVLAPRISKILGKKPWIIIVGLVIVAAFCETFISFGPSFCLILIPPMLSVFNGYKVDRRKIVTAIMCGLQIGYICIPVGFGAVFQGIVADAMHANGIKSVTFMDVTASVWPIGIAMICGAIMVTFMFRKPREYTPVPGITAPAKGEQVLAEGEIPKWELKHTLAIVAAIVAPIIQIIAGSLPLGAMVSILLLCIFGVVKYKDLDARANEGMLSMALVSFIMAAGGGFASVSKAVGDVDGLVSSTVSLLGGGKFVSALVMLLLGIVVTMGIGSSWGTVPIVAVIMVPMGLELGFSSKAIIMLIAAAAALGDAGSPASDQTLMTTAAFNLDGQHDHIWDSCVPSFICCNIPILIICTIFACFI